MIKRIVSAGAISVSMFSFTWADEAKAYLTGTGVHAPPTTGSHAYYPTYGSFGPDRAGFPGRGQTYTDPVFGSVVRRLTNTFPNQNYSQIYSKNGYWSADAKMHLHFAGSSWSVIDTSSGASLRSSIPSKSADISFDPVNPDIIYYFSGAQLRRFFVSTGTTDLVYQFTANLQSMGGTTEWMDNSGRFMLVNLSGVMKLYDRVSNTIYAGVVPGGQAAVDSDGWVGISPDGKYIIVMDNNNGYTSYVIDHYSRGIAASGTRFWTIGGGHSDIITASDGKTYIVAPESYDTSGVYAVDVTIPQTHSNRAKQRADNRLLLPLGWPENNVHISGVSRGSLRDWAYVSVEVPYTYDGFWTSIGSWAQFRQEIVMVNALTGEIRRLAHHRSRNLKDPSGESYFQAPRVSTSWDGSIVGWASNMGYSGQVGYNDIYVIQVTASTSPSAPPPTPTPTPAPTPNPTPPKAPPAGTNLALNSTFDRLGADWSPYGSAVFTSENTISGKTLRLGAGAGGTTQRIKAIVPGATYILRANGKVPSSQSEGCVVGFDFEDSAGQKVGRATVTVVSGGWNTSALSASRLAPSNAVSVSIWTWKDPGSNYCYIDNMTFQQK